MMQDTTTNMNFLNKGSEVYSSPDIINLLKARYFLSNEQSWDDIAKRVSIILPEIYPYIRDQYFCPSTPTLFNLNTKNERKGTLSSCFIMGIEDSIEGIMDAAKECAIVTRAGGGVGYVFDLRGSNEIIKSVNRPSCGPLPFINIFNSVLDGVAQTSVRRGAGMSQMRADHPNILDFIDAKKDYRTNSFARFNFSVRIPDWFYEKLEKTPNEPMMVKNVVDGKEFELKENGKTITVKDLWDRLILRARESSEPGIFNSDIAFRRSTVTNIDNLVLSNPCQPFWAKVLTKNGIRNIGEISVGDEIWSQDGWTKVINKVSSGLKDVFAYKTTFGIFYGTKNHRLVCDGKKIEAQDAIGVDILRGGIVEPLENLNPQDIMDGLVIGDGMVYYSIDKMFLCIGEDDKDYFNSEIKDLILKHPSNQSRLNYTVSTTINCKELSRTYCREIPERFVFGSPSVVRGFLRGLYSANGSIVATRVTLKASSFRVIEDVQVMLSSLGIASYYTTNQSKDVNFKNGTYTCKKSYDLNIIKDVDLFYSLIGFIQGYKNDKLEKVIEDRKREGNENITKKILYAEFVSNEEVFDITVDNPSHTYWSGGLNVSNCGELIGIPGEACSLASINLIKFVKNYKDETGIYHTYFDFEGFEKLIRLATIYLNKIIDHNKFPLKKIEEVTCAIRPIGLGVMGLAHMYYLLEMPFNSKEAKELLNKIFTSLTLTSLEQSVELAKTDGSYKEFNLDLFLKANERFWATERGKELERNVVKYGIRNHGTTSQAPTGAISFLANCSSGIEPCFALSYIRKIEKLNKQYEEVYISDRFFEAYIDEHYPQDKDKILKNVVDNGGSCQKCNILSNREKAIFVTAKDLTPMEHLESFSIVCNNVSFAASKTINAPSTATLEQISEVYLNAYKMGCIGVTVYRDGSREGILVDAKKPTETSIPQTTAPKRPKDVTGEMHHFKVGGKDYYVAVGLFDDIPGEIFTGINDTNGELFIPKSTFKGIIRKIGSGNYAFITEDGGKYKLSNGHTSDSDEALSRLVSLALRHGSSLGFAVDQLHKTKGNMTTFGKLLARVLKKYVTNDSKSSESCPECGLKLVYIESCKKCTCGYSACG